MSFPQNCLALEVMGVLGVVTPRKMNSKRYEFVFLTLRRKHRFIVIVAKSSPGNLRFQNPASNWTKLWGLTEKNETVAKSTDL